MSILTTLVELAPALVQWLHGDRGDEVLSRALTIAQKVTGQNAAADALDMLRTDPKSAAEFAWRAQALATELYADAKRSEAVNTTMRAEIASGDKYISRWRPTYGYIVSFTWLMQMSALTYVVVRYPAEAAGVLTAAAGLTTMWLVALAVLGVQINKRSQDKQVAAGQVPATLLGTLLGYVRDRR